MFNATRVIDALDESESSVARLASGRVFRISRYAFRPEAIANVDVFKIPNLRVSPTFVSERVVDVCASLKLRGVQFRRVWSAA
jgi:hypothetical protein